MRADEGHEQWAATSPNPDKCILGRNATFTRLIRHPTSLCLNRQEYVRPEPETKECECSEQYDTECEFGWERPNPLGMCERMKTVDFVKECPAMEGREISATNMRIIAGSSCVDESGALGRDKYRVDGGDGGKGRRRGRGVLAFFLWMFFIGVFGGVGYWATTSTTSVIRSHGGEAVRQRRLDKIDGYGEEAAPAGTSAPRRLDADEP